MTVRTPGHVSTSDPATGWSPGNAICEVALQTDRKMQLTACVAPWHNTRQDGKDTSHACADAPFSGRPALHSRGET